MSIVCRNYSFPIFLHRNFQPYDILDQALKPLVQKLLQSKTDGSNQFILGVILTLNYCVMTNLKRRGQTIT